MRPLTSKRSTILVGTVALWLFASAGIASAEPFVLQVGLLSFDSFIGPNEDPDVPGVNAFNVFNFTGEFGLLDPNAAQALTFGQIILTLDSDTESASGPLNVSDFGPGQLLDLDGNPVLQWSDQIAFRSATLRGDVDLTSFLLPDGFLFTVTPQSLSASLFPATGGSLGAGDFAIIELHGDRTEAPTGVPEPSSLILIGWGLAGLTGISRHRRHR
jgi:hypothetical protein